MTFPQLAQNFRDFVRAEDQIAGFCPLCNQLVRLSEMELFYIPDRKEDVLHMLPLDRMNPPRFIRRGIFGVGQSTLDHA